MSLALYSLRRLPFAVYRRLLLPSGAIKGDKKKLSYVTTLVLLVAVPMMIIQPWLSKFLHLSEIVGGAWLGGTLDTTASVSAAASNRLAKKR